MNDYNNQLDYEINSELMKICKCILPYLERDTQRNVAIGLKILELINTVKFFEDINNSLSVQKDEDWQKALLLDVSKNLNPDKAYMIEALLKANEINTILNTEAPPNQNSDDFIKTISPMLDDKQQQILSLFTTLLN
ncbi:MAG: hypothetical protein BEN19_08610 [Epulopiscium sp. Nuni2H_MBin003]|nr:MAG: hypothetical protein BEN19_08610 [Epulopiscium sp. Nuni2H_MBin003]